MPADRGTWTDDQRVRSLMLFSDLMITPSCTDATRKWASKRVSVEWDAELSLEDLQNLPRRERRAALRDGGGAGGGGSGDRGGGGSDRGGGGGGVGSLLGDDNGVAAFYGVELLQRAFSDLKTATL